MVSTRSLLSKLADVLVAGSTLDPGSTTFGIYALSFSLYACVYKHRPDLSCIIHLQTPAVTAVSAMKCGLLPLSQEALICGQATTHSITIDLQTNRLALEGNIQQSTAKVEHLLVSFSD